MMGMTAENVLVRVTPNSLIAEVNIIKAMLEQNTDNMRIGYQKALSLKNRVTFVFLTSNISMGTIK